MSFYLFDIGVSKLYAFFFCNTVQVMNHFDGKIAVCGVGDIFFLDCCVDDYLFLLSIFIVQTNAHCKNLFYTFFANTVTEFDQFGWITRKCWNIFIHSAEALIVGITFPLQYHILVTEVFELFEYQQSDHQANRLGRSTFIGVVFGKGLIEGVPVYCICKGNE